VKIWPTICACLFVWRNLIGIARRLGPAAPRARVATWSSPPREGNLDGIICGSRLSGETNLVVFDRASPKLTGDTAPRLVDCRANLAAIITAFDLTLV
jgi:hypothetical protein